MNTTLPSRNVLMGIIRIALIFLFATHFFSCTDEQTPVPTPSGEEKMITLSLTTPKRFIPATYASDGVNEDKIQTIDVLIFSPKEGGSPTEFEYFSGPHYGSLENVGSTPVEVTLRIPQDVPDGSTLAIFANSRKVIDAAGTFTEGDAKNEVLEKITLVDTSSNWETVAESGKTYNLIPMHGEVAIADIDDDPVSLVRMVARIDVTVTDETLADFDLTTVYLYNRNVEGYVASVGADKYPDDGGTKSGLSAAYSTTSNKFEKAIYTFEAAAGDGVDFSDNTCIVIGGRYEGDAADTYYRVDFFGKMDPNEPTSTEEFLPLLRNYWYTVSISKVYGSGYANALDAAKSRPVNVEYKIAAWGTSDIVDGGYNGQYMIGVSAAKFNFDAAARNTTTGDNVLIIKTNHPDGWSWKASDVSGDLDPSTGWLKLTTMAGADITAPVKDASGLTTSEVRLELTENAASSRNAVIKLTAGNVTYDVSVTQSDTKNDDNLFPSEAATYNLRPNGDRIFIPVSRANAGGSIKLNPGDVFKVEVASENPVDPSMPVIKAVKPVGTGASGQVYVETGTGSGTATVSLKDAAGNDLSCTWTITVREPEANSYIVKPNSEILIPISQIRNFETALSTLPNNDGTSFIAAGADAVAAATTAAAWFDDDAAFTADWLWKDNANLDVAVSPIIKTGIDDAYIKVSIGGFASSGNAVVAVMQDSGDGNGDLIRWSWHIWVSSTPIGFNTSTSNGVPLKLMDRNLGASSKTAGNIGAFGMHYQWGRKDPFPAPTAADKSNPGEPTIEWNTVLSKTLSYAPKSINASASPNISASDFPLSTRLNANNNVDYSVANPHTFYHSEDEPDINTLRDWYSIGISSTDKNKQNNNLWGGYWTGANLKTAFDPCPPGWRVPTIVSGWATAAIGTAYSTWGGTTTPFGSVADYTKVGYNVANSESNGYTRDGGWYPAAGRRFYIAGVLAGVGSEGYYWSASPYHTTSRSAGSSTFDSTSPSPSSNIGYRSQGFSVRCVKESPAP